MKATEYKVVRSEFYDTLERKVNELIAQGWQPSGSLVLSSSHFYQPMILIDNKSKTEAQPVFQEAN